MALTPEDVVTKQFQHVRFKEGFDPDEVDDFLDEIVVEWRKTIAENDELKTKLAAYESGETPAASAPVADDVVAEDEVTVEPEPEKFAEAPEPAAESAPAAAAGGAAASAGIIELAQRLHDEHVAEGQAQRDKLVSEAEAQRDKLVSEAEAQRDKLVSEAEAHAHTIVTEAEAKRRDEVARLDAERTKLEARISELRQFESDYRNQLRGFIEEKLSDLDATGATPVAGR